MSEEMDNIMIGSPITIIATRFVPSGNTNYH